MYNIKRYTAYYIAFLFLNLTWVCLMWSKLYIRSNRGDLPSKAIIVQADLQIKNSTGKKCLDLNNILISSNIKRRTLHDSIYKSRLTSRGHFSVEKTRFLIKKEKNLLHLVLNTYDNLGNPRSQGGDFLYATLSDTKGVRRTAGKTIDYENGTYSIYFYVNWEGNAYVNVTLVNPREDVMWIKNVFRSIEGKAIIYGIFQDAKQMELQPCAVYREGIWKNKCEFRNENSLGKTVIICEKPPNFKCKDLKLFTGHHKQSEKTHQSNNITNKIFSISQEKLYKLGEIQKNNFHIRKLQNFESLQTKKRSINMVPLLKNIHVQLKEGSNLNCTWLEPEAAECLPECGPGLAAKPVSDGYWSDKTWNSLVCKSKKWGRNQTAIFQCLKDKNIYFVGDSTLRQWFEGLVKLFEHRENATEIKNKIFQYYFNKRYNLKATFHFHFWAYSAHSYSIDETKYMADFVDSLSDTKCDYIVFLTASFHFANWTRESYGEMLAKTKEAIDRLLDRCPNSAIIVKGSHTFGGSQNKWILYDMNLHLHQIFANDPRIIFINVWDMHLSYSFPEVLHAPSHVITQELFLAFSHICTPYFN